MGLEKSDKEKARQIIKYLRILMDSDLCPKEEAIQFIMEREPFSRDFVEKRIEELIYNGILHEPKRNKIKFS